jgi:uncharacterized protein YjbJ (UPF0337 family)
MLAPAPPASKKFAANSKSQRQKKEPEHMDKDRIIGSGKQMTGSLKQVVGKLVGDAKLQTDGKVEQVEGKLQNAIGSAKDTLKR